MANGRMIGGFGVIAAPVRYGVSGIKTFIVSHEGVVHEADLKAGTAKFFATAKRFNPDKRWQQVNSADLALHR